MRSAGRSARRSNALCGKSRTASPRAAGASTSPPFCCACSSIGRWNSCCDRLPANIPSRWLGRAPRGLPVRRSHRRAAPPPGITALPRRVRRGEHAGAGIHPRAAAAMVERRAPVALRSVLAEPEDPPLVCGAVAAGGTCPCRGRLRRSSLRRRSRQRRRTRVAIPVARGHATISRSGADAGVDPRRDGGVERSCPSRGTLVAAAAWPTAQAVGHDRHIACPRPHRSIAAARACPPCRPSKPSSVSRRSRGCCVTSGDRERRHAMGDRPGSMPARTR